MHETTRSCSWRLGQAVLLTAGLLGPMTALSSGADKTTGSAPVTIVNDASHPIPVAGEVSASVTGPIEVSSVPAELTDRIDLVLDRLEDIRDAAGASGHPRANYARTFRYDLPTTNGIFLPDPPTGNEHLILDRTVWASFITISTENDDGYVHFYSDPARCCEASDAVLRFGHRARQLPSVITAPLPQAVPIRSIRFVCTNSVEDCEVAISIVGTVE